MSSLDFPLDLQMAVLEQEVLLDVKPPFWWANPLQCARQQPQCDLQPRRAYNKYQAFDVQSILCALHAERIRAGKSSRG